MRKLTAVGCLLLFCAGWAVGQQDASLNGTNWKNDHLGRTWFLLGFNRGYSDGVTDGIANTVDMVLAVKPVWTPEETKKLKEKAKQIDQRFSGNSNLTIGQLEDTVSIFYGDYRNALVCWDDAARLSTLSLAGNVPTEQELNAARKKGVESGCH